MASTVLTWLIAIPLLGLATGMRSMTAIAVCCWFAYLGLLPIHDTWAFWTANLVSVLVFSLAAIAEYIADKLPRTPARTAPAGLFTRIAFGGLVGALVGTSLQNSIPIAALLGIGGALVGTFGGYLARKDLVRHFRCRDWTVALMEDFLTILIAVFALRLATA